MEVGGQRYVPAALHPGRESSSPCTGDQVGPRAELDG
jgi:hypothetical protein